MADLCDLIKLIDHIEAHRQPPPPNDDLTEYINLYMKSLTSLSITDKQSRVRIRKRLQEYKQAINAWI
jgi:hypothetical protein